MPRLNQNKLTKADREILLTQKDVARMFQVHTNTIRNWLNSGSFPTPVRFSDHCIRWRAADIERFINSDRLAEVLAERDKENGFQ